MIKNLNSINQKLKLDKFFYFRLFFSLVFSFIFFFLSLYENIWPNFWGSLKIPPNVVPFSDFKGHLLFLNCEKMGINIYLQECILIPDGNPKVYTYPKIWIYLFDLLNLQNKLFYNFSILFLLIIYFYTIFKLFEQFEKLSSKIVLIILLLSTSNFVLIERLSSDLIIFILAIISLNLRNRILQAFTIFLGFFLKYFPIFIASIFIEKKKFLFFFIVLIITFSYFFYLSNFNAINDNMNEMALPIAYGSRTMLKAFYHLSMEFDYFLNDTNINFYRNLIVLLCFLYSLSLILIGYKVERKKDENLSIKKYFLAGASIYIGTFIIGANADYRLIFLILTIPYIMDLDNKKIKYLLLFCYFFSFNSFYFLSGPMLSATFFIKASFVFACKFFIFSLLSFQIGSQLKKIEFFKI